MIIRAVLPIRYLTASSASPSSAANRLAARFGSPGTTNAVRTSAGPGPGVKYLPPAEAGSLVARRLAVHGDQPPRGYSEPVS